MSCELPDSIVLARLSLPSILGVLLGFAIWMLQKPDMVDLNTAFAFVSIFFATLIQKEKKKKSSSKLIVLGKVAISYPLSCLTVQLWTINKKLIIVAIIYATIVLYTVFREDSERVTHPRVRPVLQISQRLPEVSQTSPSVPEVLQTSPSVSGVRRRISPSVPEVSQTSPSVPEVLQTSRRLPVVSQTSPSVSGVPEISPSVSGVLQTSPSVPGVSQTSPSVAEVLQTSPSVSGVRQTSPSDPEVLQTSHQTKWWRLVALLSSVVALISCAQSPTFHRLIRGWNPLKRCLYVVVSLVIFTTIIFARQSSRSKPHVLKKIIGFAVFILLAVCPYYYDKALNEKPDILGVVSCCAFALVSLSLSKLINFGLEMGFFTFFLGCFVAQLWTIRWWLISVAMIPGYLLYHMHSSSDSQQRFYSSLNSEPEVDSAQVLNSLSTDSDAEVRGGPPLAIVIHPHEAS